MGRLEEILDDEVLARCLTMIEAALPIGVRARQLSVRSLLLGMLLCQADHRPAHLSRVHRALVGLCEEDRRRLGISKEWNTGAHLLTYRQVEYTHGLVQSLLRRDELDGSPSLLLEEVLDRLLEASVPERWKTASSSLAVDWSDIESFSRPPLGHDGACADPEASWGHRRGDGPGQRDELFFGYYFQLATMVGDQDAREVPELVRRLLLTSCHRDPPLAFVPVLERLASGAAVGDVLCDSGYAHRVPEHWAGPIRLIGAELVMDLHPHDRGPKGTYSGAIVCNGNLYCPMTPRPLLELGPLARDASPDEEAAHDVQSSEASRYKLGRICSDDVDGYHRVMCPAAMGKLRCPLRAASMALSHDRPEVLSPPEHPPTCCCQQSITVPPQVNAKTAQRHDYPSVAHRRSYRRRTAGERANSTVKDPATIDVTRGWCRLMGLVPMSLFLACAFVVRNCSILEAFDARQADEQRRRAAGLPPRVRRRRRKTLADMLGAAPNAPP